MIFVLQKIECVHNNAVMELMRGVRSQLTELISGLAGQDLQPMSLGLSHSLSRYKLKFSADKVLPISLFDHYLHKLAYSNFIMIHTVDFEFIGCVNWSL